jgi:hypothetical protein
MNVFGVIMEKGYIISYFLWACIISAFMIPITSFILSEIKSAYIVCRPLTKEEKKIIKSLILAKESGLDISLGNIPSYGIYRQDLTHILKIKYGENNLHEIEISPRLHAYISEFLKKDELNIKNNLRKNKIDSLFNDVTRIYLNSNSNS